MVRVGQAQNQAGSSSGQVNPSGSASGQHQGLILVRRAEAVIRLGHRAVDSGSSNAVLLPNLLIHNVIVDEMRGKRRGFPSR